MKTYKKDDEIAAKELGIDIGIFSNMRGKRIIKKLLSEKNKLIHDLCLLHELYDRDVHRKAE